MARDEADRAGIKLLSGTTGAAMARLDDLCVQRSGEGVSARRPNRLEFEPAAESGRGTGLNIAAVALRSLGEERGEGVPTLLDNKLDDAALGEGGAPGAVEELSLRGFIGEERGVCGLLKLKPG